MLHRLVEIQPEASTQQMDCAPDDEDSIAMAIDSKPNEGMLSLISLPLLIPFMCSLGARG